MVLAFARTARLAAKMWAVPNAALALALTGSTGSADDVSPVCLEELASFAAERDLDFDPDSIAFASRWAGAGHEVSRLPGTRARLPMSRCDGALAVDLGPDCRILKSRGEGACRADFPLVFY